MLSRLDLNNPAPQCRLHAQSSNTEDGYRSLQCQPQHDAHQVRHPDEQQQRVSQFHHYPSVRVGVGRQRLARALPDPSSVTTNGMWPASRGPSRTARVHVYSNPTPMYTHNMSSVKTMRAVLAKGSRDNWPNLPREASITVLDHIRSRLTAKNASTSATHLCHSRGLPPWPPRTQPDMLTYQTTCT
jgi:hypothetical protein